jgi:hypothetical protein
MIWLGTSVRWMYRICIVGENYVAKTYVPAVLMKSIENKYKIAFSASTTG